MKNNALKILNLTQHQATQDQVEAGVVDLPQGPDTAGEYIKSVLTFDSLPSSGELVNAAGELARIANDLGYTTAMIGGAPFFMSKLEEALKRRGIKPLYAFSIRESVEEDDGKGGVRKTMVFKHLGFVDPTTGMEYGL